MDRREFLQLLAVASLNGLLPNSVFAKSNLNYDIPVFGQVRLLHITDTHAQLQPVYYREPHMNIGVGTGRNQLPHMTGQYFLDHFDIVKNSRLAYAFSSVNFAELAMKYGKVGGFSALASLINKLTTERGEANTLLLDGGDTWQGSATAYWTQGQDMVGACNLLGVDVMTGHWEFTYPEAKIRQNIRDFQGDFVAQNIRVKEEALFEEVEVYDEDTAHAFPPYVIKVVAGVEIAVIGQAFPYTPIANPQYFIPHWTFGIQEQALQALINSIKQQHQPSVIVLLSHNGMDVDKKLAQRVSGLDVILGGHTHDAIPQPLVIKQTLVANAGSNGKFVGVLDLDIKSGKFKGFRYHLLPVFANLLAQDNTMQAYIDKVRLPYREQLQQPLAISEQLLYRRGNFNGSFDQLLCDAMRQVFDAEIALSPGFRWGTSVLPGDMITFEDIMNQTAISYPQTYVQNLTGRQLKDILEDVADNLFNADPYLQQGGDMVRLGGLNYSFDPNATVGHRISQLTLDNGKALNANKSYKVAGWASVVPNISGQPIWDIVAEYLSDKTSINISKLNLPNLKNTQNNLGISLSL